MLILFMKTKTTKIVFGDENQVYIKYKPYKQGCQVSTPKPAIPTLN